METVEVGGLTVAYERAGSGPPVLLLHGYVGDGSSTWRHQLDELSDEFTVISWDAPGAGASSDPPEAIGLTGYADQAAGFVRALGLADIHVVGLSFGGVIAIELARRHPRIARSLTLTSAYAGWAGSLSREETDRRLRQALELSSLSGDELVAALMPTMFSTGTSGSSIAAFEAALRAFHPAGLRAMARAAAEDVSGALPAITTPTLLVYGSDDVRAPLDVAHAIHAGIAGSELVVIAGAGHLCNVERPDEFNSALRAFLRRHPG